MDREPSQDPRFLRQMILAEVGPLGQARICGSRAAVAGDSLANEVAERYARGAGFAEIVPGGVDLDALAPPAILTSGPARQVLAGARLALAEVRAALKGAP